MPRFKFQFSTLSQKFICFFITFLLEFHWYSREKFICGHSLEWKGLRSNAGWPTKIFKELCSLCIKNWIGWNLTEVMTGRQVWVLHFMALKINLKKHHLILYRLVSIKNREMHSYGILFCSDRFCETNH